MADHGIADAVKLASNELPWPPTPRVLAAAAEAAAGAQRYPDARATAVREALAGAVGTGVERVAVGCGASGLLQQLALAYVEPGAEVVRGDPSFEGYPLYTRLVGGRDVAVPARRGVLDTDAMADAVTATTRLVLLAEPNNPTGTAVGADAVVALADRIPAHCLLVVDAAYREFAGGPDVATELALERPNVVALRTFSKAHALAGLRIGWAVAHPDVIAALDAVLLPFAVGAPAQAAALASLAEPDEVERRVSAVVAERGRLEASLRGAGWDVTPSAANFVWLPGKGAAGLAERLERAGVVTRAFPGVGVRVSIGTAADNDRAVAAIGAGPSTRGET